MASRRVNHGLSRQGPVVLYAGFHQFGRSQRVRWPRVHSRMLMWCRAGCGEIWVNGGEAIAIEPDDFTFTPWRHDIEYRADARDPFLLVGIHIVPRYTAVRGLHVWAVSHKQGDACEHLRGRSDATLGEVDRFHAARAAPGEPLRLAAEYVFAAFLRDDDTTRRIEDGYAWADLLLREMKSAMRGAGANRSRATTAHAISLPPQLRRLIAFVETDVARITGVEQLAEFAACSRSTVERLFRRHLHLSPLAFIVDQRVRLAKTLLTTGRLPIAEVGKRVGLADAFYFSKFFRSHTGRSPREYRRTTGLL